MNDLNKLTIEDAYKLIESEKHPDDEMEFSKVYTQIINTLVSVDEGIYACQINDYKHDIQYNMINRQTEKEDKFSIMLIMPNNVHLIRFDFGSKNEIKHYNNFRTENEECIRGSHVHILSKSGKYVNKNVIPIDNFENFENFVKMKEAFKKAIQYFNIQTENIKNEGS